MEPKPLVILSRVGLSSGVKSKWNRFDKQISTYIEQIVTGDLNLDEHGVNATAHRIISGVPSPWARPLLFKYAIEYLADAGEKDGTGIKGFYSFLQDEWKGLIACLALEDSAITVEKYDLAYSDGKSKRETQNLYELSGALGNMLFEDAWLWQDPNETDVAVKSPPFLQIIKYNGTVIGATSPFSLAFTAPVYLLESTALPFYANGKFFDPLKAGIDANQLQKLYLYVRRLYRQINEFQNLLNQNRPDRREFSLIKLQGFINHWIGEIENYARNRSVGLTDKGALGDSRKFAPPFDTVFNLTDKIFYLENKGVFLTDPAGEPATEINPSELLLPDDSTTLVQFELKPGLDIRQTSVYYLEADSSMGKRYFSLPLSEKGLRVFSPRLSQLLGYTPEDLSGERLTALYVPENQQIKVTLRVNINGVKTEFNRTYNAPPIVANRNVMVWPDFVAPNWKSYYLYSELPHNASNPVKCFPLLEEESLMGKVKTVADKIVYLNEDGASEFGKLAVRYDYQKLNANPLQYEIYESKLPFRGVELRVNLGSASDRSAGYLLMKQYSNEPASLKNCRDTHASLKPARVGVDFGSNNTCVAFSIHGEARLLPFKNRRKFIIGLDEEDPQGRNPARPHELFFFQSEEPVGQLKSMIQIHDPLRLAAADIEIGEAVSGGFPVFERNVPVVSSTDTTLTVGLGSTQAVIKYNMKWSHDDKDLKYKKALLKILWLKINAELYAEFGARPEKLLWAYPSAMSKPVRLDNASIWKEAVKIQPIDGNATEAAEATDSERARLAGRLRAMTESEAVCNFALSKGGMAVQRNGLSIGFDVGGSTTDILILGQDPETFAPRLVRQTSIRLAAGKVADVSRVSRSVQETLRYFARKHNLFLYGMDDIRPETAAYLLNVVFDRADQNMLSSLYSELYEGSAPNVNRKETRAMFAVTAYLSGLILFYTGQQVAKIMQDPAFKDLNYIQLGFYGKGAKIFDWLPGKLGLEAEEFYCQCLLAGAGYPETLNANSVDFLTRFDKTFTDPKHNKAEVTLGLAANLHEGVDVSELSSLSDIVGEEGFTFNNQLIDPLAPLESIYMEQFGKQFNPPEQFVQLNRYLDIYFKVMSEYQLLDVAPVKAQANNLSRRYFRNYFLKDAEFKAAFQKFQTDGKFEFVTPLIISAGMCLLDEVILPECFKNA